MALIFTAVLRFLCSVERRGGGGGGGGESFYLISPAVQNLDGQIQQSATEHQKRQLSLTSLAKKTKNVRMHSFHVSNSSSIRSYMSGHGLVSKRSSCVWSVCVCVCVLLARAV